MECDSQQSALFARWQHLHMLGRAPTVAPSVKCDVIRSLMAEREYGCATNILCPESSAELLSHFAEGYTTLVDSPEEQGGVNNFAEAALAITSGRRNESKDWTTSFSRDSILQLSCVQRFFEESRVAEQRIIPEGKENEVLHLESPDDLEEKTSNNSAPCKAANPEAPTKRSPAHISLAVSTTTTGPASHTNISGQPPETRKFQFKSYPHGAPGKGSNIKPTRTHPEGPGQGEVGRGPNVNGARSLYQNIHHGNGLGMGDSNSGGTAGPSHTESFWNMGAGQSLQSDAVTDAAPCQQHSAAQRNRSIQYPNNTNPYAKFAPEKPVPRYKRAQKRPYRDVEDEEENDDPTTAMGGPFRTASEQLAINNQKKYGGNAGGGHVAPSAYGSQKRSLGTRRGPTSRFIPPVLNREDSDDGGTLVRKVGPSKGGPSSDEPVDERLKNIDPKMIELISNEIMDHGPAVGWDDIAGLEFAKTTITEIVVWPMLRPDIFTGLRGPPKGLLLFGPPGTGKTLIGKCIASQSKSTFFSISASSLTSKWVGEGEKMVRALFAVAMVHQPAVIFIDEIDSLLSQRTDGEHEASRRIKTEFLVQLDGATTGSDDRVLVVGATNRPQEIDEAARRRFVKRLYIPLPEGAARRQIVVNLMRTQPHHLADEELNIICERSQGYSGADMSNLCREAALGPIRSISMADIEKISADQVRPIVFTDFKDALEHVRPSVSEKDLGVYLDWNKQYGSWGR